MAPPHVPTLLTKRGITVDLPTPVIAAIVAVVAALNALIILTWCIVTRRYLHRSKPRRPAALCISSPFNFTKNKKNPLFTVRFGSKVPNHNNFPQSPSTRDSKSLLSSTPPGTHGDTESDGTSNSTPVDLSDVTYALDVRSFRSGTGPLDGQSLKTETASIYSAASAPRWNRGRFYTQTRSFTLDRNAAHPPLPGRPWQITTTFGPTFAAMFPSRLKLVRPSGSRSSSLASDDGDNSPDNNLAQLLSRVEITRRHTVSLSTSSPASSLSDVPVVPRPARIRTSSIPILAHSNTTHATLNFHARQLSLQTTAPLNVRPREKRWMSVGAPDSSLLPSHTTADEQPHRAHDRPIRPPSHVVWRTVEKIESVVM